jgi:hypothetical protein
VLVSRFQIFCLNVLYIYHLSLPIINSSILAKDQIGRFDKHGNCIGEVENKQTTQLEYKSPPNTMVDSFGSPGLAFLYPRDAMGLYQKDPSGYHAFMRPRKITVRLVRK